MGEPAPPDPVGSPVSCVLQRQLWSTEAPRQVGMVAEVHLSSLACPGQQPSSLTDTAEIMRIDSQSLLSPHMAAVGGVGQTSRQVALTIIMLQGHGQSCNGNSQKRCKLAQALGKKESLRLFLPWG